MSNGNPTTTLGGGVSGHEARTAARRKRLFGRPVAALEGPELLGWLRNFVNAHPNPAATLAREAHRWLVELERGGAQ